MKKIYKLYDRKNCKINNRPFLNCWDKNLNKNQFSKEEDLTIISLYKILGNCWDKNCKKLNGKMSDMDKNSFYCSLKKIINNENGKVKRIIIFRKKNISCYE